MPFSTSRKTGDAGLSVKRELFCQEYMKDLNATAAAKRAGYSAKTANEQATYLLGIPAIQAYIKKLKKKMADRNEDLTQRVIDELAKIAFSNVQDFIENDNKVLDLSKVENHKAAAVSSIKKTTKRFDTLDEETDDIIQETVEFRLWDKGAALERLGRHLGIFEEDNKQKSAVIKVTDLDE